MKDNLISWEESVKWLKDQPDQQELVRHCYYDDPLAVAAERFNNSDEWHAVLQLLNGFLPGKVLDLGAGRGISSYAFAKAGCEVTALEPDLSTVVGAGAIKELVKTTQLPINVISEYAETLPFSDSSFDIVYGRAVFHHARDLWQFCSEASRVLRKGGVFIATREHVISRKEDLQSFLCSHPLHHLYGGENAYLLTEYTEAILSSGLRINKIIGPLESAVNYAPMTCKEFEIMITAMLSKRIGKSIAKLISSNMAINKLFVRYLSEKKQAPGSLYSFLAVK